MSETSKGRFVWYELLTTDTAAAKVFYGEVIGWKTQPFGGDDYSMWVGSQGPLGGVMTLPEEAKQMGAPSHWESHVSVANVHESVAKARELGARVFVGPKEVPTVGTFAIIGDPQGAIISLFQSAQEMAPHDASKHGEFCWSELATTDLAASTAFYAALFGWETVMDHDMGPMGTYRLFGRGEKQYGGMFTPPAEMKMPSAWLYYSMVDDLESAIARATRGGAKVLNGPMEVPGGARIAQLLDPQGAAFALHTLNPAK